MLFRGMILVLGAYVLVAFAQSPQPSHYADAPPPAHTGGFGEPTCRACHFGAELNAPGGKLVLENIPKHYAPGQTYSITVHLTHPEMERGGFELSARFAEGPHAGAQAGAFHVTDSLRTTITRHEGIQYIHQTMVGATLTTSHAAQWTPTWSAPDTAYGPVVFHASANAANHDDSAFGDFIYVENASSLPGLETGSDAGDDH